MTTLLVTTVAALGISLSLLLIAYVVIGLVRDRAGDTAPWDKGPVAQEAIDLFTDLPTFEDWPVVRRPFDQNRNPRSSV